MMTLFCCYCLITWAFFGVKDLCEAYDRRGSPANDKTATTAFMNFLMWLTAPIWLPIFLVFSIVVTIFDL
jgi:hypothetical protein